MKVKYAIYKTKVGLRAMEYYDKIDPELFQRMGVLGWQNITEDRLPIVVNSAGGRCSFYPVEENFVKIIEVNEDQKPLTREEMFPRNSPEFEYGWISPDGDTYNTGFEGHLRAAEEIVSEMGHTTYNEERYLEEMGWVKITKAPPYDGSERKAVFAKDCRLTKKQADRLVDLGYSENTDVKFMIENSEGGW